MIELRWRPAVLEQDVDNIIEVGDRACVLQYRYFKHGIDASGAINVLPAPVEYSNWQDVEFSDD